VKYLKPAEVENLASMLQRKNPSWKYIVKHNSEFSYIEVYNENGEFVSRL
jgi:ssDNA-specific exonuclease RecJ